MKVAVSLVQSCAAVANSTACTPPRVQASGALLRALQTEPALLSWLLFMLAFHAACYGFELCDSRGYFFKHKHFRGTPESPSYAAMLPTVLRNQAFCLLPSMIIFSRLGLMVPSRPVSSSPQNILASFVLSAATHEVLFYLGHRFVLHTPWGYVKFNHSLHHSSPTNSAISSMYMAPIDFLLEIVLPYIGALWLSVAAGVCSPGFAVATLPLGSLGGLYEHSGYNFLRGVPGLDTALHANHHTHRDCSFADGVGAPSLLDPWLGTACGGPGAAVRAFVGVVAPSQLRATADADARARVNGHTNADANAETKLRN
jgi:sterol desaturase/sphingolipid hydroxylase (fatty acid hydroxylase superfamily)